MSITNKIEKFCDNSHSKGRGEGIIDCIDMIYSLKGDDKLIKNLVNIFKVDIKKSKNLGIDKCNKFSKESVLIAGRYFDL